MVNTCTITTTSSIDVEINGIQAPDPTTAEVSYTLTGVPTEWGKTILAAGMNLQQSGTAFGFKDEKPEKSVTRTAVFQLYDDGWRIVTISKEDRPLF